MTHNITPLKNTETKACTCTCMKLYIIILYCMPATCHEFFLDSVRYVLNIYSTIEYKIKILSLSDEIIMSYTIGCVMQGPINIVERRGHVYPVYLAKLQIINLMYIKK